MKPKTVRKKKPQTTIKRFIRRWSPLLAIGLLFPACKTKKLMGTDSVILIDDPNQDSQVIHLDGEMPPVEIDLPGDMTVITPDDSQDGDHIPPTDDPSRNED